MGKKNKGKGKGKKQLEKDLQESTQCEIETPGAHPLFNDGFPEFVTLLNKLDVGDHFYQVKNVGLVRIRVNPNLANGNKGRKNLQLDNKPMTRPKLKSLMEGETTPAPDTDNLPDPPKHPMGLDGNGPGEELLEKFYKKKAFKAQLELMDIGVPKLRKKVLKPLDKKIEGYQIRLTMMAVFNCDQETIKSCLEALCR